MSRLWPGMGALILRLANCVLLSCLWLALVVAGEVLVYRFAFQFDATSLARWEGLYGAFLGGATIPFNFVGAGFCAAAIGAIGGLVLGARLSSTVGWCARLVPLDRVAASFAFAAALLHVLVASSMAAMRVAWGGALSMSRAAASVAGIFARRSPERRLMRRAMSEPAMPAALACARPRQGSSADADGASPIEPVVSHRRPTPLRPDEAGDTAAPAPVGKAPGRPSAADLASFARAMAVIDVWAEPAPDWMCETLRDELARLSEDGWQLVAELGPQAPRLLDAAARHGLLPATPPGMTAVEALRSQLRAAAMAEAAELGMDLGPAAPEPDVPPRPAAQPRMTLAAAWLCDLLENYQDLERRRTGDRAGEFDGRWGALWRETVDGVDLAMRQMTDADWASLDQFPHRAGAVRVLTDRLREEFRGRALVQRPMRVDVLDVTVPANPHEGPEEPVQGPVGAIAPRPMAEASSPRQRLEAILRLLGLDPAPFAGPSHPGQAAADDVMVLRDGLVTVIRLVDLDGREWRFEDGGLGSWRASDGTAWSSPCRAVWQRVALQAVLEHAPGSYRGLVVLAGGRVIDEPAVAAEAEAVRRRSGVELVWLEESDRPLADLRVRLAQAPGLGGTRSRRYDSTRKSCLPVGRASRPPSPQDGGYAGFPASPEGGQDARPTDSFSGGQDAHPTDFFSNSQ